MPKYFVFSYFWKKPGASTYATGTGTLSCNSIVNVYEYATNEPEDWIIVSVSEISQDEFDAANDRGILG